MNPMLHARAAVRVAVAAALLAQVLVLAGPAHAHGIGGGTDRSIAGFGALGFEHMLLGWDHLLFIGGVVLLARGWRPAAKLISLFVLGHSLTLIVATLASWQVNPYFVDVVIAISVLFVGYLAITKTRMDPRAFGVIVLGFGLVHGLGLSTRLQELGLPEDGLLARVIAFNIGVEIGQLTAILAVLGLAAAVSLAVGAAREPALRTAAAVVILIGGAAAVGLGIYQGTVEGDDSSELVATDDISTSSDGQATCEVAERTEEFPPMGGHAAVSFFEPDQTPPLGDFGHSIGDGYVVVLYPTDIGTSDLDALRAYVTRPGGSGILAGPGLDNPDDFKVLNAYETLTCTDVDLDAMEDFSNAWFKSLG